MFHNDVFGYGRNNVFGFNNPLFGNSWSTTPFGTVGNQNPWQVGTHTPYQMNMMSSQFPFIYNQVPHQTINPMMHNYWNTCQPQNFGMHNNQSLLPVYGTSLPYQTTGYFGTGINQGQTNFGHNQFTGSVNPYFSQYTTTPWGFGSTCR